jgi:transcriptional regulator with XRE-family HTH domain
MKTSILDNFGKNLKKVRTEMKMSQEEFADKLNVHRTHLSKLERGLKNISLLRIEQLSIDLKIKLEVFLKDL